MANKTGSTRKKQLIPAKIKAATPENLRLQMIEAEAQGKKEELAVMTKALQNKRKALAKKELAARKLVQHLAGEHTNTPTDNVFTEEELREHIPEKVIEDVLEDDVNIIFKPNPGPQTDFLAATEKFVLFGGARGGGKSYSLIVDPLRYCNIEDARALLLRKTMPELRDMINHAQRLYRAAYPDVKWREQEKEFRFPSGARIEFGYAENEKDAERYQGQAYTWIGVDEIGLYATDRIFTLLKGSLRSANPNIPTFMRMTCNPGGAGMHWIKEQFVDAAPWNTTFNIPIINYNTGKVTYESRRFIPAKLEDNPYLNQTEDYMNMLLSLPDKLRKMWLDGRWDIIEGAAFEEFDPTVHVVEPFEIPSGWPRFRSCDWGFSTNFCVLWCAVDYENTIWVYREFYGKGLTADIFAQRVRQQEMGENIQYGVMDSSVWARRGDIGPPIPEIMRQNGCLWRPSDRTSGSRKSGKAELHRRLRIFEDPHTGEPTAKIKFFKTCRNLIRTVPALPLDKNDMEDIDTRGEDHCYDALRYGIMSRPMDPTRFDYYQQLNRQSIWTPANLTIGY